MILSFSITLSTLHELLGLVIHSAYTYTRTHLFMTDYDTTTRRGVDPTIDLPYLT